MGVGNITILEKRPRETEVAFCIIEIDVTISFPEPVRC